MREPEAWRNIVNTMVLDFSWALLGLLTEGGQACFTTPAVRPAIVESLSARRQGLLAVVAAGIFARNVNSVPLGILFGPPGGRIRSGFLG